MTVKILVCGDVKGQFETLIARINVLQSSAHGPFAFLFITGSLFTSEAEFLSIAPSLAFPLPTYAVNGGFIPADATLPENLNILSPSGAGLISVSNLTVAYIADGVDFSSPAVTAAVQTSLAAGYRGCDLLLSSSWPREIHQFLDSADLTALRALGVQGGGSKAVADLANRLRPRYHFATGSNNVFFQRPPYKNEPTSSCPLPLATRFIGLATVSASKEKDKKWLHALSLEPIIHLSAADMSELPPVCTDSPYVSVGKVKPPVDLPGAKRVKLSSDAPAVGALASNPSSVIQSKFANIDAQAAQASGSFFFGRMGVSRDSSAAHGGKSRANLEPPSAHAKTLFLGGISADVPNAEILRSFPNSVSVRRMEGKAFLFLDFSNHGAAAAVVSASQKSEVFIRGKPVAVGWANDSRDAGSSSGRGGAGAGAALVLEPPSPDATVLFIGGLPFVVSQEELLPLFPGAVSMKTVPGKAFGFITFQDHSSAAAAVRSSTERAVVYQDKELAVGWSEGDKPGRESSQALQQVPPSGDSCTLFVGGLPQSTAEFSALDVEALLIGRGVRAVRRAEGKDYAFVEFRSHADASDLMASSDGRLDLPDGRGFLSLGWAKGRPAERSSHDDDCWFCLGSQTLKVHLIVSVGEHSYVALPRGGIVDYHVMISPIECVPSRLHLSEAAKKELARYEDSLERFFGRNAMVSMRFERTIRTKGKDHMQEHVLPLPAHKATNCLAVFMQLASQYKLHFQEIQDERGVEEVVLSLPGGPYQEYFFLEIPVGSVTTKAAATTAASRDLVATANKRRFVYVPPDSAGERGQALPNRFPMHLGFEIAATALGAPERANWKNCMLTETEEGKMADRFKKAFAPFDFTQA